MKASVIKFVLAKFQSVYLNFASLRAESLDEYIRMYICIVSPLSFGNLKFPACRANNDLEIKSLLQENISPNSLITEVFFMNIIYLNNP